MAVVRASRRLVVPASSAPLYAGLVKIPQSPPGRPAGAGGPGVMNRHAPAFNTVSAPRGAPWAPRRAAGTRRPLGGRLAMIAAGTVLDGRYRLDHQLARRGFARVFLGSDLRLRRYVAVEVLNPELLGAPVEQDFRARFATEAAVVARLDHPNILGLRDYGEAEGTLYLVMPYVAGGTLEDRLRGTSGLPLDLAGRYLRQAALALDYAHGQRVVHRDVKPQNMLLCADGERLLLADFGIARLVDAATALRSRTATLGTLAYMAPEQFQGRAGPATDVYALGCVLFQLLTGEVPYTGPTEQVMFAHVWERSPRWSSAAEGGCRPRWKPSSPALWRSRRRSASRAPGPWPMRSTPPWWRPPRRPRAPTSCPGPCR